ncbi:uncharacterized protein LOC120072094 [Benincasa hispida]|uniref:uncharacterized protein LOC120072094 n=1 Tax=Benincasa hispida TaxID=102211 RepID=UPI001900B15A|nr:uncharacterized protein LOC120072094 [Benincasa hispida]
MQVGNERRCFAWCDPWLPVGSILENYGEGVVYDAASYLEARPSDFLSDDGYWHRLLLSWELRDLWDLVQDVVPRVDEVDRWVWVLSSTDRFIVASAWKSLRPRGPRVAWACLLWFRGNIPRHSFWALLMVKDRLGTRD